ncbi:PREDICTED: RB1-inducible coiled-coil protein 1 isoform X3 [Nicrophorus vespilloides]|uniref:RB1-inducible coiled-coil protein 1 isoform X3 n=1 Tax=Nicrophorus vespilloides TaxID=110193 RepID=A0ABM1M1P2_NICVS|nr:PREDICTED: RB1-inducible coiled-coil protein 1 isoform X3 [Nicrophorus vespilloides]
MLYVFYVDIGSMMTFDMSLAIESVSHLKKFVEKECGIPVDKQVLLVSGGVSLEEDSQVCSYSAGTDTNPIFLFSKCIIESITPEIMPGDCGADSAEIRFMIDLKNRVEKAKDLPPAYETIAVRAKLAMQFHHCAKQQTMLCEKLVHEQHLQQQGWAAVVANLEDITNEFRNRSELFEEYFNDFLSEHDNYKKFLQFFNDDLEVLGRIPVIHTLLETSAKNNVDDRIVQENDNEDEQVNLENKDITLFEWISSTDSRNTMEQLYDHCSKGLEQFDQMVFSTLHKEIELVIRKAQNMEMKEVKGLSVRLCGLEQLMITTKKYVREQFDLAQSFQQNQNRAGHLGDKSILPDLCESHRNQLNVMDANHALLCDIRRRCAKAKEELCLNLFQRLKWVMFVQNMMIDANHKLVIYHDNLKRLRQNLEILQQIHLAPVMYLSAIVEVVRRREFSQSFLMWASELACHVLTIHNEEVARRKEFQSMFEGHFLNALFPGMEDMPPTFATQTPSIFDSSLPKVTAEDVHQLRSMLPDMSENCMVHDISAVTSFFSKFFVKQDDIPDDGRKVEDRLVDVVNEIGLASNMDQNLLKPTDSDTCLSRHLSHVKELENETDTDEFEKVGQSPQELQFDKVLSSLRPGCQDASTITTEGFNSAHFVRSKSISPHTPQSPPKCGNALLSPISPTQAIQPNDFINDEYYIDESLPSSLSIDAGNNAHSEYAKQLSNANDVVALLQDNLQTSRNEQSRLKSLAMNVSTIMKETSTNMLGDLKDLKTLFEKEKAELEETYLELANSCTALMCERDSKEQEIIKRLSSQHEIELNAFKRMFELNKEEMLCLNTEKLYLDNRLKNIIVENERLCAVIENNHEKTRDDFTALHEKIAKLEVEKDKTIKEVSDKLTREHKTEMDNLRTRFRLVSELDRSPSDANLEKIDKSDQSLIQQIKDNLEYEKSKAIEDAKMEEAKKWSDIMESKIQEMRAFYEEEKDKKVEEIAKRISDEKDILIKTLRQREEILNLECLKNKNMIQQMTELQVSSSSTEFTEKIAALEKEKYALECKLRLDKQIIMGASMDMSTSVALCPAPIMECSTSSVRSSKKMKRQMTSSDGLNVESCAIGDTVLVVWDEEHENFTILQNSPYLFFLHSDSVSVLDLKRPGPGEKKMVFCTGEVEFKEYCHAKKSQNRYKVPKGTKFYRIQVKPVSNMVKSQYTPLMSQSAASSRMDQSTIDPICLSLPSSPTKTHCLDATETEDDETRYGGGLCHIS